jgi:hypothetical protein
MCSFDRAVALTFHFLLRTESDPMETNLLPPETKLEPQGPEIFDAMREAGWVVSVRRDLHFMATDKTFALHAKSPSGKIVYILCRENEVVSRLQEILNWK